MTDSNHCADSRGRRLVEASLSGQHAAKWVEDRTDGLDVSRAMLFSGPFTRLRLKFD